MARVLVVEDSPTQAEELRCLLEDAGFEVDAAADGVEALAMLRRNTPAVIVTDLQMPKMDGLRLVEAVREEFPNVPVVLITAHGSEEIASQALRKGAASYVPKRYIREDLAQVVRDIAALAAPDADRDRINQIIEGSRHKFTLSNDDSLVAPLVRRLEVMVSDMGVCDASELIRLAVALREAIVNAIDHGNLELDSELRQEDERIYRRLGEERRGLPPYSARKVRIEADLTRSEATFEVEDEGPGFDPSGLPDPTDPENLCRIGGRGLLLIRTLMDEVRFNDRGNRITLIKRKLHPQGASTSAE